jgi:hypothetical protein
MAFVHGNTTVKTTPTLIASVPTGQRQNLTVYIQNNDSAAIYIGDATVATSGATIGWKLNAGANIQFWCNAGDSIYAISAAGTATGAIVTAYSA